MEMKKELQLRTELVEEIIASYLPKESTFQKTIVDASNYAVLSGGKRIRPLLMLETYRLFDGNAKVIEPFMAAIEMIHSSSLVHDDLPCMDNDEYRRGRKSTWAEFGEDMGVLAGDALMIYAFETAAKAFSMNGNPRSVGEAIRILAEKTGIYGMIGGQTVDVETSGKGLQEGQLEFIYGLKTGALLEASMMIGAVLAEASKEDVAACEAIARRVGFAFQIRDDILDVTSTFEELGKPIGSDEKNEKTTYVTLYGLDKAAQEVERLSDEAVRMLGELPGENALLTEIIKSLVNRRS